MIHQTVNVEALAEKLASLKLQSKAIDAQVSEITEVLLQHIPAGKRILTPEYSVDCQPGRSSFKWNNKEIKKQVEDNGFKNGLGDYTVGKSFITVRFLKHSDPSDE